MIVTFDNLLKVLDVLDGQQILAIDLETTGLRPYHGDDFVGMAIASEFETYYFNFNHNEVDADAHVLKRDVIKMLHPLFQKARLWLLANAKFDMHFLYKHGFTLQGDIYDVLVMARVERNDHLKYSLDECAKRIGREKSTSVMDYLKKHRLYTKVKIPGKKKEMRNYRFDLVPERILAPYAERDVAVTYDLFLHQQKVFNGFNATKKLISPLIKLEMEVTKVCFEMERRGMLLDVDSCRKAQSIETEAIAGLSKEFKALTKKELVDSNKHLKLILKDYGYTEDSVDEKHLTQFKSDNDTFLALKPILLNYRSHRKKLNSYFSSFLYHMDEYGYIHANYRQSATGTGRFSISDPALQTINKDTKEEDLNVRECFISPPGFKVLDIDYKNMEYRGAIDKAEEVSMAAKISSGYDPHQAAADLCGIERRYAKAVIFLKLYGGGAKKLASDLGTAISFAKNTITKLFSGLPKLDKLIKDVVDTAKYRGYIINAFGRRYWFDGVNREKSYKAFNYWVQGSCADAVKLAMVRLHKFLEPYQTKMVLQVHDSVVFYLKDGEEFLIPEIKKIMIDSYPSKILKMDCSVEIGPSWGKLKPYEEGNNISKEASEPVKTDPPGLDFIGSTNVDSGVA
jgi:DNA polymerase-1